LGPQSTQVQVKLVNTLNGELTSGVVAYRAGEGEWQLARQAATGEYLLDLPAGEKRYQVAVSCQNPFFFGPFSGVGFARVYLLTTDDTDVVSVPCPNPSDTAATKIQVKIESGEDFNGVEVYSDRDTDSTDQTQQDENGTAYFVLDNMETSTGTGKELVVLAYNGDALVKAAIKRGLTFPTEDPVVVAQTELQAVGAGTITPTLPSGEGITVNNVDANVLFVSAAGVTVFLDANNGAFPALPGTGAGDRYLGAAWANLTVAISDSENVDLTSAAIGTFEAGANPNLRLDLPDPAGFNPKVAADSNGMTVEGLSHPNATAFVVTWVFPEFAHVQVLASKNWLDGQETLTLPDLGDAPGFRGLKPMPEDQVNFAFAYALLVEGGLKSLLASDPLVGYRIGFEPEFYFSFPFPMPGESGTGFSLVEKSPES